MKTIHHVFNVDASVETVWDAITTEEGLGSWWSTEVSAPAAEVGGVVDWTFVPGFNPDMEIVEIEPPRRLVWKCVGGHDKWADNTFTFEVVRVDGGRARLRFWQHYAVELDDDDYGIYNFNWGYYLESLRLYCADGAGKPHRPE